MTELQSENKNIRSGAIYFYIHFVTEVICFFTLSRYVGDQPHIWLLFLSYDMLAFVPQGPVGYISDRFPRIPMGAIGLALMIAAAFIFEHADSAYSSLIVLCLGNCLVHVSGAETTLRTSHGKLSGSAIFVSGGSFGVVTGKLMSRGTVSFWIVILLVATAIPLAVYSQRFIDSEETPYERQCDGFKYSNPNTSKITVILMAVAVVAVRGFMGYGIPTSWNKTVAQTVLLFSFMGVGKALGGVLADRFGFKRTAMLSALLAAPLLMAGDKIMIISLAGVMLFSMTMAITLGVLVSAMPGTPGLAFGLTTIGLFLGTAPVFFFKFTTLKANSIMIAALTALCLVFMWIIIRKDGLHE